jgi:hypothetical protein
MHLEMHAFPDTAMRQEMHVITDAARIPRLQTNQIRKSVLLWMWWYMGRRASLSKHQ